MALTDYRLGAKAIARRHWWPRGWTLLALGIAAIFALPVVMVASAALSPAGDTWRHLSETVLPLYVTNSIILMLGVGIGTAVIGAGTAWLVTMCRFPGQRLFEWALFLPMAVPAYVLAYTYTGLFDVAGPVQGLLRDLTGWAVRDYWFPDIRSMPGAIAMMVLVLYPYVYLVTRAAFLEQSVCALEIGRTLGCSPWGAFWRIGLPLARPALATGVALSLMEALGDFGTVQYFAVDTFTSGIFRTWLGLGDPVSAAHLAALLLVAIAVLMLGERYARGSARFHHTTTRYRPLPRLALKPVSAVVATLACALPILLGFVLPAIALSIWALGEDGMALGPFLTYARNTLTLALPTAALAVGLAVLLGYGQRLGLSRVGRVAIRVAAMGYAIPGAVIAVGVLVPIAGLDNAVDAWMRRTFGVSTGLVLTGSIAAVVFAYLVRFLAVAFNTVESGLEKVTPSMDAAARSLGRSPLDTLRRVHLPMMRASLTTAALLVFVDVMKELPATLMMRPFNFDTLAIKAYELASDERLPEAALPSLAIVFVGVIPVILMSRAIAKARPGSQSAGS
ncbi:ABC transporter permease [Zavarzinia sp.]|uniref:ABC transporter permease n=1 Tax=Zavarzinia sp. TaxID=2027920 RepID=UPI003BB4FBF8